MAAEVEQMEKRSSALVDVALILKNLGVLKKDPADQVPHGKPTEDAFFDAMQDAGNVADCVAQLFPNDIPLDKTFFDQLNEFHRWVGLANSTEEGIGRVWSEAMRRLAPEQQQELLKTFARQEGHDFFENVRSLHVVMKSHAFPAAFLADWFVDLLRAIERDLMQGEVWNSIRTVCICHVEAALATLKMYLNAPDARRCTIAGYMLGILRSVSLNDEQAGELAHIERDFREHAEVQLRGVFNWSWVATSQERELMQRELNALLARAEKTPDDLNNVTCVVCRLISIGRIPDKLGHQCRAWISGTASPTLSSEAKYYVVDAANALQGRNKDEADGCAIWIQAIQPVAEEDAVTWDNIGAFLADALKQSPDKLAPIFTELCRTSAQVIHGLMATRRMRHFLHDLRDAADVSNLVGTLALSVDTATRKLGLFLLDELDVPELSEAGLQSSPSIAPKLLFYELQRTILKPTTIARILAGLVPIAEKLADGFQEEFFEELKLQCQNFSGTCRHELEALRADSPLVAKALVEVSGYFDALKRAHDAGINAMEVAGHRKAIREQKRLFAKRVSEGARSASPLLSMMNSVSLLYGRAVSQFIDGQLGGKMALAQMSTSMELPMVDFFDPEEMALRRLHASTAIARLVRGHCRDGEGANE